MAVVLPLAWLALRLCLRFFLGYYPCVGFAVCVFCRRVSFPIFLGGSIRSVIEPSGFSKGSVWKSV